MKIKDILSTLTKFKFIHSIILFGSRATGTHKEKSDFDLCIITNPNVSISLKERIALENSLPENIDLSLIDELPVNIRKRVFLEGKVLYTNDFYYILTLAKQTEMEYLRYRNLERDYHKAVMNRVRAKLR
jgi:predicted nucleotidyltransferase